MVPDPEAIWALQARMGLPLSPWLSLYWIAAVDLTSMGAAQVTAKSASVRHERWRLSGVSTSSDRVQLCAGYRVLSSTMIHWLEGCQEAETQGTDKHWAYYIPPMRSTDLDDWRRNPCCTLWAQAPGGQGGSTAITGQFCFHQYSTVISNNGAIKQQRNHVSLQRNCKFAELTRRASAGRRV